ncbi:MAG: bifunctional demethylmenaquinone methyltransferase/2-methoxy-6-polyprenyl-1,4-benzoquinol methylase UbiE [Muribaculaceae bacterium]|nr:bifunctional demethylmenaquinone methyltransferase/2-methoxy-6-polyprenyl-1,4-benzoquinol methylase UbiE [Muribaculaceae bacterium]
MDNELNSKSGSPSSGKSGAEGINPYDNRREKGEQVEEMFDSIAPAYDFMNTAMTFGLHRMWRNKALKAACSRLKAVSPDVLDVATGTGDVAFRLHSMLPSARIIGIDLSKGMLDVARKKLSALPQKERALITFGKADCLDLPYLDNSFDLITVAYGVRNFENLLQGLKEMRRVLRPGGTLCVIELSVPQGSVTGFGYRLYSRHLIPTVGKMVSGDSRAYTYLPESIAAAPQRDEMGRVMKSAGFNDVYWKELTFGAVTYYLAR